MSNKTLSVAHGWNKYIARHALGITASYKVDSTGFRGAVEEFQVAHNLVPDGLLGGHTWGVLRTAARAPESYDIERLGAIIQAECASGTDEEKLAVGSTVRNRILTKPMKYGSDPVAISIGRAYAVRSRDGAYKPKQKNWCAALVVLTERACIPDITHFYSPLEMPKQDSPVWPGARHAQHRHYYREGTKYFLWDAVKGRIYTSTRGGWVSINGTSYSQPGFALKKTYVPLVGVDPERFRFYKRRS